jgi:protein-tyrosine phosphatase
MSPPPFVDVHSHVVPSGDDGAVSVEEAVELCAEARRSGTQILFATPHVHAPWDSYPWSPARAAMYDETFPHVQERASELGLDLRRGFEVFPSEVLVRDPAALLLEGTRGVLVEFPGSWLDFSGQLELVLEAAARISAVGFVPVLAHPERCREVQAAPGAVAQFIEQGSLLCLNGPSLLGDHGEPAYRTAWELLQDGHVQLIASDGHRASRPPTMDAAWHAVCERLGEATASPLFDGSALPWLN